MDHAAGQLDRHRRKDPWPGQRFLQFLQHPENREQLSFDLREDGYDDARPPGGSEAPGAAEMADWPAGSIAAGDPAAAA